MPLDGASVLYNGTIPLVLVANQVVKVGDDRLVCLVVDGFTRVLARDHAMEETEAISAIRVSHVVAEFSQARMLRTDVSIERGPDCC